MAKSGFDDLVSEAKKDKRYSEMGGAEPDGDEAADEGEYEDEGGVDGCLSDAFAALKSDDEAAFKAAMKRAISGE